MPTTAALKRNIQQRWLAGKKRPLWPSLSRATKTASELYRRKLVKLKKLQVQSWELSLTTFEIVKADHSHILPIAWNMRQADVDELKATSNDHPVQILTQCFNDSSYCWCILADGKPAALFGAVPVSILGGTGTPWMLGTDDMDKVKKKFISHSRKYLKEMTDCYPILLNFVDVRNVKSIRWLKWLGFAILPPIPAGINGEFFHPFEMRI